MKTAHRLICVLFWLLAMVATAAHADTPGKNGARTITALGTVVNQSTTLAVAAGAGNNTINVTSAAALSSLEPVGGGALAAGDVILLYQPRSASITTTNTESYGTISAYGSAGNYELRSVSAVAGNVISLEPSSNPVSCIAGLKNNYPAGSQVLRVPQYSALTVNAGASITSTPWNGTMALLNLPDGSAGNRFHRGPTASHGAWHFTL